MTPTYNWEPVVTEEIDPLTVKYTYSGGAVTVPVRVRVAMNSPERFLRYIDVQTKAVRLVPDHANSDQGVRITESGRVSIYPALRALDLPPAGDVRVKHWDESQIIYVFGESDDASA